MSALYVVLPLALVFAAAWIVAFAWATRRGQLDDLDTPAARMLFDDDEEEGESGAESTSGGS